MIIKFKTIKLDIWNKRYAISRGKLGKKNEKIEEEKLKCIYIAKNI